MLRRYLAGSITTLFASFLVLARPLAAPAGAEAKAGAAKADDSADPVAKVKDLNRTAMEYFDDLNYAMAEKILLEALSIVEKANLASGPAGLSTNGNLAVLYSVGFKKPDKAVFHFKKALAIKPDLKLSKQRASPETEANLARAKAEIGGGGAAPVPGAAAPKGAEPAIEGAAGGDFRCPTGGEVQAGDEITFKCLTASNLQPATVMAYYKVSAAPEFEVARMTTEGVSGGTTTWVVKIPSPRTQGTSLLFYFEANDPSGNTLAQSGSEANPSVIAVKGGEAAAGAGPPPVAEGEGEEGEEEEEEGEEVDDSNPLAALERERWREHQGSKGTWLFSLGLGSGFGYAAGQRTEAFGKFGVTFKAGLAPAFLGHAVWEVAYFVGRKTALSIGGRHQWIQGALPGAATGAHSLLLRSLFFTEDEGKVRWYFACAAGWGEGFRLQVTATVINPIDGKPMGTVKDTVRGGPFVAGIGGGMLYKISRRWRWTVDTQALVGFAHVSAVLDLTTGARWQF
jgi:hypothetical protein